MRKLICIIALICFVVSFSNSQTINMKNKTFDSHVKSGIAADSALATTATYWSIRVLRDDLYKYDIYWKLDSAGDGSDVTLDLWGSYDVDYVSGAGMSLVQIGSSVTWYETTSDTTIRFTNTTNSNVQTNASHTETYSGTSVVASHVRPHSGSSDFGADSITVWTDTTTVAAQTTTDARVNTIAAQTITSAEQRVGWAWLVLRAVTAGADGKACSNRINVAILKDD